MDYIKRSLGWILAIALFSAGCSGGGAPATTMVRTISPTVQAAVEIPSTGGTGTPESGRTTLTEAPGETQTTLTGVFEVKEFPVPRGSHPHDVAPAPDGSVWYTAQAKGELGRLDPETGNTVHIPLGSGSSPHGVVVGPDGAPWITDSGLNAIVRVDPETEAVKIFPLPQGSRNVNLNTGVFDPEGVFWFTGQSGYFGQLDPADGEVQLFEAPRARPLWNYNHSVRGYLLRIPGGEPYRFH
jgi:streptogramin lyase